MPDLNRSGVVVGYVVEISALMIIVGPHHALVALQLAARMLQQARPPRHTVR
jgi:hypothetical protein